MICVKVDATVASMFDMKNKPDFWSFVDIRSENECWPWLRPLNKWGYGRYRVGNLQTMAHRVAYKLATGKSIDGFVAMHVCDNPSCCNPKHLLIGTHADNQADKYKKNRQAKGEENGQSLLTEQKVLAAREKYKSGKFTYKQLADQYGVCRDTMQKAIRGIYWKHI